MMVNNMNPYMQYMYSYPHKTAYRSLSGILLSKYASLLKGEGHGLYLHIPFCQTKCGYCNLFSVTGQTQERIDRYLAAVERQSRQYQEILEPYQTVFSSLDIGGGTPLLLTKKQLERMFGGLKEHFQFCEDLKLGVETAPNQTTKEKLAILKQAGVSRISMGIQSFSDRELGALRRQHNAKQAKEALTLIKFFDFSCVNVDFIYGIPGQTVDSLLASLREAISFEPDEIFIYPLYVKHGAGLEQEGIVPEPEEALLQYRAARDFLKKVGFRQDSMRRFVRGSEKRQFSECGFGTSLALGCGGRSYLGRLHFCSPYAITRKECLLRLDEFEQTEDYTKITHGIFLSEEELKRRYVIRHLLIRPGLALARYYDSFGSQVMEDFPQLYDWEEKGYLLRGEYLSLSDKGLELSDYLGPQLISAEILAAMVEWEKLYGKTYDFVPRQPEKL